MFFALEIDFYIKQTYSSKIKINLRLVLYREMERLMTEHGNRKSLKYNSRRHVQNSCLTSRISRKHSVDNGERNIGSHHQVSTNKIKHPLNDFLRVNRVNSYMSMV